MKLILLLALALVSVACDNVISSADPTPPPATPPPVSPPPKPGAWMKDSKSGLDQSSALGEKKKK